MKSVSVSVVAAGSALLTASGALLIGATSQAATEPGVWSEWTREDAPGGMTVGTMTLETNGYSTPAANYETDAQTVSRSLNDFLNVHTPPGARFGSSEGSRLLRQGLKNPAKDDPSTAVYKFGTPTPAGHFSFILGDIDVDEVRIAAIQANGDRATAAELGFKSVFNFCNGKKPYPDTCEDREWSTKPQWVPSEMTLRGSTPGNETEGASGWFVPTVRLSALKFHFVKQPGGGSPTYRTWFASDQIAAPTPTPTTSPTASPTTSPTPTPTPTPTPSPTVPPKVPLKVETADPVIPLQGTTTVVKSIKTPGKVSHRVVCRQRGGAAAGEVRLCTHTFRRADGSIRVRTFGVPVGVTVQITSKPKASDKGDYRANRKVFKFRTK